MGLVEGQRHCKKEKKKITALEDKTIEAQLNKLFFKKLEKK